MSRSPVPEARLVETDAGMKPEGDGWFVVNMADAVTMGVDDSQYAITFDSVRERWPDFGINVRVLRPGKPAAVYHAEGAQEAFLVLEGEGVLIMEDEERPLRQWDFVHCAPHTAHVIVGAGDGPCVVLMVGAHKADHQVVYPVSQAAARYGASVDEETTDPRKAYAGWPAIQHRRFPWPPQR